MVNKLFSTVSALALVAAAAAGTFPALDTSQHLANNVAEDECPDLSSPQCCYDAYMEWTSSKASFEEPTQTVVDYTETWVQETFTNVPTTTLCDGFLRYLGPLEGEASRITIPADEPVTTWVSELYTTPAPSCTINESDCIPFMEDYRSSYEAYQTNNSLPYPTPPPCTTYSSCPGDGEGMCKMLATAGKAYYWPVTVEGDLCGDYSTITHPEPTRSTVIEGTTFVSPSIYISVEHLRAGSYAGRYSQTPCGRDKSNFLLTLDPTDVSTHHGPISRSKTTFRQLNLADLNEPVPVTAYFGLSEAPDCGAAPESCTATVGAQYTPRLSAPVQWFRDLDPDYEFCELHPSASSRIGPITWIPLEPTQDWPQPTAGPDDEDDEDEEDED